MAAPGFQGVVQCIAGLGHSKRNGPHALTKGFREAPDHRTAVPERRKPACGAHGGCYSEASCFSAINGLRRVSGSQRTEVAANGADRIDAELEYSDSDGESDGLGLRPRRRRGSDGEGELLRQFATAGQARAPSSFWAQQLSMLLLMGTALFFLGLACAYLNVRSNGETTNTIKHLFCSNSSKPGCGAEELAMLQVLGSLYNHLGVIAGDYDCGDHAHTRRISLEDARDFILAKNLKYKSFNDSLQRIINSTSDLGMRLIGEESNVRVRNVTEVRFLESTHPRMSLSCRIWRACISVLRKALLFLVGVVVVWFVLAYIHYRWRKEEEEVRQVYHMAERITDTLQSHSQRCREDEALPPFLPMENVKNMIIPQHDRARLRRVWERAEAFICKHEPRAKQELRSVGGQDCPVWRWIPSIRSTLQRSQGKIWQGKAFQWDRRTYPSPTPCLKIRNMFDPDMEVGETWHLSIHDAILDRCRDNDGIAHIEVDKSSHEGCVYIKCLAPEHAGKAFKALHGSWFDGKLVTVKYLRLDRYHQRFPHAIHSNSPLHRTSHVVLPSS